MRLPTDCVVAVTYDCNSRCTMCDIWKIRDYPQLPPSKFAELPSTLQDINISGGEPFLRADLPEIVAALQRAAPRARMVISTNGFLTDLVVRQMKKILAIKPDIGVAVSIDGVGEMQNEIRGIPDGYNKCIATVRALQGLGMTNLRIAFTILEKNVDHFPRMYDVARELGVEFTHSYAQSSEFFFGGKQNDEHPDHTKLAAGYRHIIASELQSWNVKRWVRAFFADGMYRFITRRTQSLDLAPGRDFFFLDPNGTIYPSVVHNVKMGDLNDVGAGKTYATFAEFWLAQSTEEARQKIDALRLPVWMICTVRSAIRRHPWVVGGWILRHKLCGYDPVS